MAGNWMQTVGQSFLVLQLTHSGALLGATVAARFLPVFLFAPLGGVLADRFDRHRALIGGVPALVIGLVLLPRLTRIDGPHLPEPVTAGAPTSPAGDA